MPYKIKTDCYKNGVFFGSPTIYAPKLNATQNSASQSWTNIGGTFGDWGYSLFRIPYSSSGSYSPFDPFSVSNCNLKLYPIQAVLPSGSSDTYDFYVKSTDNNVRIIRMVFSNNPSYPDQQVGVTIYDSVQISYILNGVVKVATTLFSRSTYYSHRYSGNIMYSVVGGFALPWKGYYNGEECLMCVSASAQYKSTMSDTTPYDINPNADIGSRYTGSDLTKFNEWLNGYDPEDYDPDDPYPDPDDDDDGDDPDVDPIPGISVVGSGFATIFTPTKQQLRSLSSLFWNETIFDFFQNLVENISDMFLSLAMVPFVVPAGSTVSVTWLGIDTAVSLTLAAQQFLEFDMGSINLANDSRIWKSNSALDYSPFSQLGIYLPFVGFRDLDIDDCRGKTINLRYRIDILSGECVAIIKVGGAVMYQFAGNCLTQIPITNEGMQALVADAVQVGLSIAAVSSSGGAASAEIAGETGTNLIDEIKEFRSNVANTGAGRQLASTTANAVIGGKPMYGKTGSVSGAGGLLAVRQPYLYLKTPVSAIPNYYRRYCGYPCNKTGKLGSFSGYTVVEDIRLNHLVATSSEVSEIYNLLKGGVIV